MNDHQRNMLRLAVTILGRWPRRYKERAAVIHGIALASAWTDGKSPEFEEVQNAARGLREQELTGRM